jgi:hypothetical protein
MRLISWTLQSGSEQYQTFHTTPGYAQQTSWISNKSQTAQSVWTSWRSDSALPPPPHQSKALDSLILPTMQNWTKVRSRPQCRFWLNARPQYGAWLWCLPHRTENIYSWLSHRSWWLSLLCYSSLEVLSSENSGGLKLVTTDRSRSSVRAVGLLFNFKWSPSWILQKMFCRHLSPSYW